MAAALPTDSAVPAAATAKLRGFRDGAARDSDASDTDQSDASGRSLSPTRQGLSKTKKRKERRQFGAFADELGDLLGAAFHKDEVKSDAAPTQPEIDVDMQVEPTSTGPKMSKRQRQNMAKMEARRLAKEQSKMVIPEQQTVAAERRGMTIQAYRGQRPEGRKDAKSESMKRRSRKERERLRKKAEAGDAMEVE
ncbi:hypothetical protein N0V95_004038 [Ascochyta clinopodiicola]|nr:hypothetical protein N0V95_004038 [Ascochyta clinopodiicola]